jgi:hypothetical protein
MYKKECDKYPAVTSYKVVGKTFQNNDIWAFRVGNSDGGKIIIDGCLHGWEDLGSEITFIWIRWLLESNDPEAKKILRENCWIVVPVVNFDSYDRGNIDHAICSGGVDLNRNFVHGWVFVPECTGDYGTSHGANAGSEKETQALRAFMDANKPAGGKKSVYINTHYGGGPWIHYDGNNVADYYTSLRNKTIDLWNTNGIVLKNTKIDNYFPALSKDATPGGEAGDAADFGYEAFTIETLNQNCINGHKFAPIDAPCITRKKGEARDPSYDILQSDLYPIFRQFFLALSESVTVTPVKK